MQFKPQDLETFEAYKKAMKAAASQIGNNTPFCIYSDVQMPDASKKMHTLKPFLVVGTPASAIAPMLKDLHGGKTLACSGLCSLQGGKISLVAKSGSLNYGPLKSQATVFKDLLGKEILIPAAGGSAPAAKTTAAATKPIDLPAIKKPDLLGTNMGVRTAQIKTPFGPFVYFDYDESNGERPDAVKQIVEEYKKVTENVTDMNSAYKEALAGFKKLPSEGQIKRDAGKASKDVSVATGAAKIAYLDSSKLLSDVEDISKEMDRARTGVTVAVKQLQAEKLGEEAQELKKKAEEEKEAIEAVFQIVKMGVHEAKISADRAREPEKETEKGALVDDALGLLQKAVTTIATSNLLAKAEDCEKRATKLKNDALITNLALANQAVQDLGDKLVKTVDFLTQAQKIAREVGNRPMNIFDEEASDKKLALRFKDLKTVADTLAEARDLATDILKDSGDMRGDANEVEDWVSGQWHVPDRGNCLKVMEKFKAEAVKLESQASAIQKDAIAKLTTIQKLNAEAQEAMAKAH